MKRTVLLILMSLLAVLPLAAQDRLAEIEEQLRQAPVQEKIYVHMDNTCYFKGDTVWYKAYVVRADDLTYTDMSRIRSVGFSIRRIEYKHLQCDTKLIMATLGFTKDLYFITSTVIDWMDVFTRPAHNAVKQEIVAKPEDYVYSSARNYCGQSGLIDVVVQP